MKQATSLIYFIKINRDEKYINMVGPKNLVTPSVYLNHIIPILEFYIKERHKINKCL